MLFFFLTPRRDSPGGRRLRRSNGNRENRERRVRGTRADQRVVLHVQHDMRPVRHDLGVQGPGDPGTVGRRPPVVGAELRRQDNARVFRGLVGRRAGET